MKKLSTIQHPTQRDQPMRDPKPFVITFDPEVKEQMTVSLLQDLYEFTQTTHPEDLHVLQSCNIILQYYMTENDYKEWCNGN